MGIIKFKRGKNKNSTKKIPINPDQKADGAFTGDAAATALDNATGKTAYVKEEKITGAAKQSASGSGITDSSGLANITDLPFTPRLIIVTSSCGSTIYKAADTFGVFSLRDGIFTITSLYNTSWVVTSNGFSVFTYGGPNTEFTWEAHE